LSIQADTSIEPVTADSVSRLRRAVEVVVRGFPTNSGSAALRLTPDWKTVLTASFPLSWHSPQVICRTFHLSMA